MMMSQAIFSLPLKLGTDCGTTVATPVINYLIAALDRRQHYSDFFVNIWFSGSSTVAEKNVNA